jgi:tripartite-type tricarboxylate transporter receptor subunit TctC
MNVASNIVRAVLAIAMSCTAGAAIAEYPDRPIRLIVPYPPGGGADVSARIISQHLAEALGKPVVAENKPGGAANIGTEMVARAAPDGYTLLLASLATAVNVSLFDKLPFNTVKDFEPVSIFVSVPLLVTVNPNVPANSIQELIALAKAKPGTLNYASGGMGTANHVAGELFKYMANVQITHVPYKGGGPAVSDLVAGHVQMYIGSILSAREFVNAGRLRALATTSAQRTSVAPDLATVAESGLPGYEVVAWYGVFAPAGTPRPIVDKLSAELAKILRLPEVRETLKANGTDGIGSTPEEAAQFFRKEVDKWSKVIKASGLKPE